LKIAINVESLKNQTRKDKQIISTINEISYISRDNAKLYTLIKEISEELYWLPVNSFDKID
jgi:hypothetical protein